MSLTPSFNFIEKDNDPWPPFLRPFRGLTAELSSAKHTCFTSSFAVSVLSTCISDHVEIAYTAIAALSPCVIPSCNSIWNPSSVCVCMQCDQSVVAVA